MKKALVVLAAAFMLALTLAWPAWARAPQRPPDTAKARAGASACFFDDESLSKTQRERLAAVREKYFRELTALRLKAQEAVFAYHQSRLFNPRDAKTLAAKYKAVEEARLPLRKKMTEFRVELLKILTPEQQAKLWEDRNLWGAGFRHGHRGPGHSR